tara:strand:- start:610 stop:963 length:354 start_codon:yes stop_codon:yes gene_type:complete
MAPLSNAQKDFLSGIDDGKTMKKGYAKRTGGAPGSGKVAKARKVKKAKMSEAEKKARRASKKQARGKNVAEMRKEASVIRRSLTPKPISKMKKAELTSYISSHRGKGKQAMAPSGLS